ncbi:rhodanese-like domain-containing protein [Bacteroidota bacterium]
MGKQAFSASDVEQLLKTGYRVLDLRHPEIFAFSFIPGSLNLVLDENFEKHAKKFLFKDEAIILVTDNDLGEESLYELEKLGYQNIRGYLKGGIDSWISAGKLIDVVISVLPDEMDIEMRHANLHVYDIRLKTDYDKGHLVESEFIKPNVFIEDYSIIDDHEYAAIVCKDGQLSMSLISFLKINGKHNLYHVTGGFAEIKKYPEIELVTSKKVKR